MLDNWERYGRCRKPEFVHLDFAPGRGAKREDIEELEAVCDGCQVWRECLVESGGLPGVWGGCSSNRRQKLRADGLAYDDLLDFDGPWELRVNRFGPGGG